MFAARMAAYTIQWAMCQLPHKQRVSTRMKDGTNTAEGLNMGRLVRAGSKVPLEERNMNSLGFHNKPHPWWSWYLQTGEQLPFTTES